MSKYDRIRKTKLLKEKRNPETRIQHITELRRTIKLLRDSLPERKREKEARERLAVWARVDFEATVSQIKRLEKELTEYVESQ